MLAHDYYSIALAIVFDGSRQFFDLNYRTVLFLTLIFVRWFGETTSLLAGMRL
jgi:hypothetical protein